MQLQPTLATAAPRGLLERWRAWRDRTVRDPAFQQWAARFPLTRPIARRRARELFDVVAGFVYSQVLLSCVRLKMFELLADGPMSAEEIAGRTNLPLDGALRLLDAAVSLRLLARRGGGYGLGELGGPMVGNEALLAMVEHHATLYRDLADPVALLRSGGQGTELGAYFPYAGAERPGELPSDQIAAYSALMTASQPFVAQQILGAYSFQPHRVLLDVAGGEGRFAGTAALAWPHLQVRVFDLPAVAERARGRFSSMGLSSRASAFGGDFLVDPLPAGADVATLIRVAHDHDDERVMNLLRKVRAALAPGGTLILAEPMGGTAGAEPMGDAYFGFYLLAMGRGRPRTRDELVAMLQQAGFASVRSLPTPLPLQVGVLCART